MDTQWNFIYLLGTKSKYTSNYLKAFYSIKPKPCNNIKRNLRVPTMNKQYVTAEKGKTYLLTYWTGLRVGGRLPRPLGLRGEKWGEEGERETRNSFIYCCFYALRRIVSGNFSSYTNSLLLFSFNITVWRLMQSTVGLVISFFSFPPDTIYSHFPSYWLNKWYYNCRENVVLIKNQCAGIWSIWSGIFSISLC